MAVWLFQILWSGKSRTAKNKCDQPVSKSPPIHIMKSAKAKSSENILIQSILSVILASVFLNTQSWGWEAAWYSDPAWTSCFNYTLKLDQFLHAVHHPTHKQLCWHDREQTPLTSIQQNALYSEAIVQIPYSLLLTSQSNENYPLNLAEKHGARKRKLIPLEWQWMQSSWFTPRAQLSGKLLTVKHVYYSHWIIIRKDKNPFGMFFSPFYSENHWQSLNKCLCY